MSYVESIIRREDDSYEIVYQTTQFAYQVEFESMTKEEKTIILIDRLDGQVNNGGFEQYFYNDGLDLPKKCLEALEKLELKEVKQVLEKAFRPFAELSEFKPSEQDKKLLSDCDKEYYSLPEINYDKIADFIKQNSGKFGFQ